MNKTNKLIKKIEGYNSYQSITNFFWHDEYTEWRNFCWLCKSIKERDDVLNEWSEQMQI